MCIFTSMIINWYQNNHNGFFYVATENLAEKHYTQNLQIETLSPNEISANRSGGMSDLKDQ